MEALTCELNIIRANNLEFVPAGNLFIRCYLLDGQGARIRLNSREIASKSDAYWNEKASLECHGQEERLRRQSVAFELRWRSTAPVLGRIVRSKLLGRAEISWKDVLESMNMEIEKWFTLAGTSGAVVGLKPPALRLGMRLGVLEKKVRNREVGSTGWKECSCRDCALGRDEEIFAIAAEIGVH